MNDKLKSQILHSISEALNECDADKEDLTDLLNLFKIINNYEELRPDIQNMLNKKARKDKWGERE